MPSNTAQLIPIAFWSVVTLVGAVWTVSLRNLFRAALSLGVVLVGVAGIFVVLAAEFLGFMQILVYVGAVLTLVIFAVMLTSAAAQPAMSIPVRQQWPAALLSATVVFLLVRVTEPLIVPASATAVPNATDLGYALVTTLVLPFEVISLVFVAAMVGAIAVAASPLKAARPAARGTSSPARTGPARSAARKP